MAARHDAPPTWVGGLADFACDFQLGDAPDGVLDQAKLAVLDTLGCILSGAQHPDVGRLIAAETAIDPREEVKVPGLRRRLPMEAAARVAAYMGDLFEWNDLVGGHASIATLPAILALLDRVRPSGEELLAAYVIGVEVTGGTFEATSVAPSASSTINYRKPYSEVSLGPVSVPSSVGAAAAVSRLLRLDAGQTRHALSMAVVLAAYSAAEGVFGDAGSAKPLLFGPWPAFIGIRSAMYAQAGLTGAPRVLESPLGFYPTVSYPGHPVPEAGKDFWRLQNPRRKYHANCGFMHSGIDALVRLRHEGADLVGAERIRIAVPDDVKLLVSKVTPPSSSDETLFHGEYNFALAALEVDNITPEHSLRVQEYLARDDFRRMLGKIEMVSEPHLTHSVCSEVSVFDAAGATVAFVRNDAPKGSYDNPMTRGEVEAKFRTSASTYLSAAEQDAFIGRVAKLERETECGWLAGDLGQDHSFRL